LAYIGSVETLTEKVGDVQVLHLRGRLDLAAAPEFQAFVKALIDGGDTKIVLDCRDLLYVSSSGLGAFISTGKTLGASGKLAFAHLNHHLQNLFDMAGIANLFDIYVSKDDAVRGLSGR
jgi:anti-sigma B factor antagonist